MAEPAHHTAAVCAGEAGSDQGVQVTSVTRVLSPLTKQTLLLAHPSVRRRP